MAVRVFHVLASLALMMVVSRAALPPERYWNAVLPNTRMPKSLVDLLKSDFMDDDDKSTSVTVGKGGVNVDAGKPRGGGSHVDVGKGGVHVDTGKPGGGGTHVSVGGGGHYSGGGGVGVHTGKPGKRTDVGVGKGGVTVHTRHKGKPVYVGVKPGPNPFVYNYAAKESQLHDDPNVAMFFLEKDLRPGQDMTVRFGRTDDGYGGGAVFLPRGVSETVPFGSERFSEVLNRFGVEPGSDEAKMMKKTVEECEGRGISGEEKYCATSLESMVDFCVSKLGKDRVRAISTEVEKENRPMQKYAISAGGAKKVSESDNLVVCHKQKFPFTVYYCHKTRATSAYVVPLEGADGTRVKAVVVCHKDTSAWNPNHLAFKVLHVEPGTVPICHFLPQDNVVWFKN
ncbi:PREDICTED: BURP domain protein RD22 [Tarenaya hassleriana]|uniref:BURP domain protein RD22 n=1 Tax=Tarenaya hassleriana TaxID=28532 RepID=UPI00053C5DCA|nr:PREDICTED: BURP domain protein RD22 [Tarenaya hassleriana]